MNHVNQRKVINDKQLQRAGAAMQMLENMNHGRRGGASKMCVPRREPGNEIGLSLEARNKAPSPQPSPRGRGGGLQQRHFGRVKARPSRWIGPHFAFLSDSKCIVCHFCRLRRFEPRSATERSKFQTENSALWPKEKSVSSEGGEDCHESTYQIEHVFGGCYGQRSGRGISRVCL